MLLLDDAVGCCPVWFVNRYAKHHVFMGWCQPGCLQLDAYGGRQ